MVTRPIAKIYHGKHSVPARLLQSLVPQLNSVFATIIIKIQ